ncbi:MAG: hypothetical protein WD226_06735 [Planctomycetota bacterium]
MFRLFRRKTLALLLVGFAGVFALAIAFALAFRAEITVDLGLALVGAALLLFTVVLAFAVRHWLRPERAVSINYNVKLAAPAMPMGRYSFRMEVFYEIDEKGKRESSQQGTVELKFRRKEHPDIYGWCCQLISSQLSQHRVRAAHAFPDARIVAGPEPTRVELEQRLPIEEPPQLSGESNAAQS